MPASIVLGLIFASLFGAMALSVAVAADHDMVRVVGTIVFGYAALVQLALLVVRRWATEMAAL